MKLLEINAHSQELLTCLCQVWESSVRATHHFLSEEELRDYLEREEQEGE